MDTDTSYDHAVLLNNPLLVQLQSTELNTMATRGSGWQCG